MSTHCSLRSACLYRSSSAKVATCGGIGSLEGQCEYDKSKGTPLTSYSNYIDSLVH